VSFYWKGRKKRGESKGKLIEYQVRPCDGDLKGMCLGVSHYVWEGGGRTSLGEGRLFKVYGRQLPPGGKKKAELLKTRQFQCGERGGLGKGKTTGSQGLHFEGRESIGSLFGERGGTSEKFSSGGVRREGKWERDEGGG